MDILVLIHFKHANKEGMIFFVLVLFFGLPWAVLIFPSLNFDLDSCFLILVMIW